MGQAKDPSVSSSISGVKILLSIFVLIICSIILFFSLFIIYDYIEHYDTNDRSFNLEVFLFMLAIGMISIVGILAFRVIKILSSETGTAQKLVSMTKEFFLFGGIQFSMVFVFIFILVATTDLEF